MKKLLVAFLMMLTLIFGMSSASYANETPDEIIVDQEKVEELVKDGLSVDEAEYLLKLDKKLKSCNEKIIISDKTSDISDEEVNKDIKSFRKRALELDPAALKKGLQAKVLKNGYTDIQKLMERNPEQEKYRVEYSDGSWVEVTSTLERISVPKNVGVVLNGYSEKTIQADFVGDGSWQKTYEMKQLTSTSYAKQYVTMKWTLTGTDSPTPNGTAIATATYLNGGGSSIGTITYGGGSATYTGSQTATAKWNSNGTILSPTSDPIQGQFQALFSTSGSIGLTGVFSINVSGTWTQYSIVRVWGSGMFKTVAAIYI